MERESMQFDVVIVGAGPAGLAAAIRLRQLAARHEREISVCVLDKASELGAHTLSGAVLEPRALDELLPDWRDKGAPARHAGQPRSLPLPDRAARVRAADAAADAQSRQLHRQPGQGGEMARRAGGGARRRDLPGLRGRRGAVSRGRPGQGRRDRRHGPRSRGRAQGQLRAGHRAARHLHAVRRGLPRLADQASSRRGSGCARAPIPRPTRSASRSSGRSTPARHQPGLVVHTIGWPLDRRTYGGSFIYHLADNQVAVGFVVGLDYQNPYLAPFEEFQRFKTHPGDPRHVRGRPADLLRRARAERGRDPVDPAAGVSGRRADRLRRGLPQRAQDQGHAHRDEVRHAGGRRGLRGARRRPSRRRCSPPIRRRFAAPGPTTSCISRATSGRASGSGCSAGSRTARSTPTCCAAARRGPCTIIRTTPSSSRRATFQPIDYPKPDGKLTFDRLSSVYISNTNHDDDQPCHLRLLDPEVPVRLNLAEYAAPEQRYCPAGVYEIRAGGRPAAPADQFPELRALQDLRHQGPAPEHQMGRAAGRRRPELRRHVSRPAARDSACGRESR